MKENDSITYLKGVGEKRAKLFGVVGISTVGDLLSAFPRDYTDYTSPTPIKELEPGDNAVFRGKIILKHHPYISPKVNIYRVTVGDDTDTMLITIFGSQYIFDSLVVGHEYFFSGKLKENTLVKECASPAFIDVNAVNKLVPKYHLTEGLKVNTFITCVKNALELCEFDEVLSDDITAEYKLMRRRDAFSAVHFPKDRQELERGRRTLAFTELLTLRLGMTLIKKRARERASFVMGDADMKAFFSSLSFEPTGAQTRAVEECVKDMKSGYPMNRLLQGDVGSGKTLVAAALCYFAAKNGCQSALMAPTEILAHQHYDTLSRLLSPFGITTVLLTGATVKKPVYEALSDGSAQVAVGTHALVQTGVEFKELGIVITDEQHRFGVRQKSALSGKGKTPHTLVMSATPIPRTLALSIYGDLDVSVLDAMPKGRIPIKTYGVNSSYRERIYRFIIKNINEGYQAYVVCPLVEKSDVSDKLSAMEYYDMLKKTWFSYIPIGLLHGRMKQAEKDEVMNAFKDGKLKLLVATTVIEVGIDVPNAVIIVIENAEQFGLSQLHQLRGRVGRGSVQSHCILITDSETEYTKARISTMVETCDGFEIANRDLSLRGPGSFFGARQHGLPELKIADMNGDIMLIHDTETLAEKLLTEDPKLTAPENAGLRKAVKELFSDRERFAAN